MLSYEVNIHVSRNEGKEHNEVETLKSKEKSGNRFEV